MMISWLNILIFMKIKKMLLLKPMSSKLQWIISLSKLQILIKTSLDLLKISSMQLSLLESLIPLKLQVKLLTSNLTKEQYSKKVPLAQIFKKLNKLSTLKMNYSKLTISV
jgi:hypothetical protein